MCSLGIDAVMLPLLVSCSCCYYIYFTYNVNYKNTKTNKYDFLPSV